MAFLEEYFEGIDGFQWDAGNSEKNWHRHAVAQAECEQVFLNRPLVIGADTKHSQTERRYFALGQTHEGRELTLAFTLRGSLVRIISARPMHRNERRIYGQA